MKSIETYDNLYKLLETNETTNTNIVLQIIKNYETQEILNFLIYVTHQLFLAFKEIPFLHEFKPKVKLSNNVILFFNISTEGSGCSKIILKSINKDVKKYTHNNLNGKHFQAFIKDFSEEPLDVSISDFSGDIKKELQNLKDIITIAAETI